MESGLSEIGSTKMFDGYNKRYKHYSETLGCSMTFTIYFPPSASSSHKSPVLYWLSGLTCTDENFIIKAGAQRAASTHGIALVSPDTSPRGLNVEGEADSYDFGVGAGFYLNATQDKWKNWRMYDYVVKELPKLLSENFSQLDTTKASISGHSMGGHGALTIYLKNLDKYKSVSAFAPIANPINCPWGQKAFTNYLGDNKAAWEEYDATCLISKFNNLSATILIDQGESDNFYPDQLLARNFEEACKKVNAPLLLRFQPGYDHSFYFIATFIEDHISHHAQALRDSDKRTAGMKERLCLNRLGNYSGAADYNYQYRTMYSNSERSLDALWEKLASEILMQKWEIAFDSKSFTSPQNQVQMHWDLYIFFNHHHGRTE